MEVKSTKVKCLLGTISSYVIRNDKDPGDNRCSGNIASITSYNEETSTLPEGWTGTLIVEMDRYDSQPSVESMLHVS